VAINEGGQGHMGSVYENLINREEEVEFGGV
jgi:hypothetical protein